MEVRCSSCATEYEFDDALVSARGTSVKCTNCGHQFRVHPPATANQGPEAWIVRDTAGKERTFTSLRELQQGIVNGELDPKHELSHAGQPFRPLQDIYELQTFFNVARQRTRPAPRTLLGVGRDGRPARTSSPPPRRSRDPVQERVTPVAGMPPVVPAAARPPSAPSSPRPGSTDPTRPPVSRGAASVPPRPASVPPSTQASVPASPAPAVAPWQQLEGLHDSEPEEQGGGAGSRWIVAVVAFGALALIAGTVGRDYFLGFMRQEPKPVVVEQDGRVVAALDAARRALDNGDFESSRAELAKASVLAEADPRIAALLAELEVARAELSSLELRVTSALLAPPAAAKAQPRKKASELANEAALAEKRAAERSQLELAFQDHLSKAKAAVATAVGRAPDAVEVTRARVDALRLEGQLAEARRYVAPLSSKASDPQNAFSLGALDAAEGKPGYPSAIDRLRTAARSEGALGKARGLLIFVLADGGDVSGAHAELEKLEAVAPKQRALPALRAFVERTRGPIEEEPVAEAPARKQNGSKAAAARGEPRSPAQTARAASAAAASASAASEGTGDAPQGPFARAATLQRQGDLDGAERLYQSIVSREPNNVKALSALGDLERQRGSNAAAAAYYDRVLRIDRNHVPTLMARGDLYWQAGNQLLAVALYRRALAQVGSSDPQGQRALRRIEEFDKQVAAGEAPAPPAPALAPEEGSATDGRSGSSGQEPAGEASPSEGEGASPTPPSGSDDDTESAPPTRGSSSAGAPKKVPAPSEGSGETPRENVPERSEPSDPGEENAPAKDPAGSP